MALPSPEKAEMAYICCVLYSFVCVVTVLVMSVVLGEGISDSYGGDREPSYDEAAKMAGYYDSQGVYQGGQPKWRDWSEDSYNCTQASQNEKYCQTWTTERYYSDPEQEFLEGNCTCTRPLDGSVDMTFDALSNLHEGSNSASSSEAALQDTEFCLAWNCHETRYTQQCTCTQYETFTSCNRRQLRTSGGNNRDRCTTSEVCVAQHCEYVESNFYTTCDCDSNGQRRADRGPDWWRELTHCEDFTCLHSSNLVTMSQSFALSSSALEPASLPADNVPLVPIDPTVVVTGQLVDAWAMDYTCTQQTQRNGSVWCGEWSGLTGEEDADVVEQLCGCDDDDAGNSGEYCEAWTCTTYYMDACEVCELAAVGIVIAAVIMICLVPFFSCVAEGYITAPILATPLGVGAAGLVAAFFGGWANVWNGVVPAFFLAVSVGWYVGKKKANEDHSEAGTTRCANLEVKGNQDAPTPLQTPMPVTGLGPVSSQACRPPTLIDGPAQPPVMSYGFNAGGCSYSYSYNPTDTQAQSMQYSPPTSPGGCGPSAPPANQYEYESPPPFKAGVDGGPGGD